MAPRENPHCEVPQKIRYSDQKERTQYGVDARMDSLRASERGQISIKLETYLGQKNLKDNPDFIRTFQKGLVTLGFLTKTDGVCGPDMSEIIKNFQKNRRIPRTGVPDTRTVDILIKTLDNRRTRNGQVIDIPLSKGKLLRSQSGDKQVSFLTWGKLDTNGNAEDFTVQDSLGNLQQGKFRKGLLAEGTILMSNGRTFVGVEHPGNSAYLFGKLFTLDGRLFHGTLSRKDMSPYEGHFVDTKGNTIGEYKNWKYFPRK